MICDHGCKEYLTDSLWLFNYLHMFKKLLKLIKIRFQKS